MAVARGQSTAGEEHVRQAVEVALAVQGGRTMENAPGRLVMDLGGSVGAAYLAGGFRGRMKMPMRLVVSTAGGEGRTEVTLEVNSRGTASGVMSGGWLGASKQKKAEQAWLAMAVDAVPNRIDAPSEGD